MPDPSRPPKVRAETVRAPLSSRVVGSRQCPACGVELAPHRQGICCSAPCRARWSRMRQEQTRQERDAQIKALLKAALRKLEEGTP